MANKPIQYTLKAQKLSIGPRKGQTVVIAQPTARECITFRRFCTEVAQNTTFAPQEVMAVLNLASQIARQHVSDGDSVDYGDLGRLTPGFKSKAADSAEAFNASTHIEKPVVRLQPNRKYFALDRTEVSYLRVAKAEAPKGNAPATPPHSGGGSTGGGKPTDSEDEDGF